MVGERVTELAKEEGVGLKLTRGRVKKLVEGARIALELMEKM